MDAIKFAESDIEFEENMEKWMNEGMCMLCGNDLKVMDCGKPNEWTMFYVNAECPYKVKIKVYMGDE